MYENDLSTYLVLCYPVAYLDLFGLQADLFVRPLQPPLHQWTAPRLFFGGPSTELPGLIEFFLGTFLKLLAPPKRMLNVERCFVLK